ncbi:HNH endonuclease [Phyllobacterium sp. K27]
MIKMIKPMVKTLAPRLGYTPGDSKARDRYREKTQHWRKWYHGARWQKLRKQILIRDCYTCQKTGVLLVGAAREPNSPVVDHIISHGGDETLFFDPSNLQAVSKEWHDSQKQREDQQRVFLS